MDSTSSGLENRWYVDVASADYVLGWVVAPEGIRTVTVFLDDKRVGEARLGLPRPDVARALSDYPRRLTEESGFFFKMSPDGSWKRPRLRVVATSGDGSEFALYEGTIVQTALGAGIPRDLRSPFPREVTAQLVALDSTYATVDWDDHVIDQAVSDLAQILRNGSSASTGLRPWLRYLRLLWADFEFVGGYFPRFRTEDPFRKDAVGIGTDPAGLLTIASHLYVLCSYGLTGSLFEFGCFKGFSTCCLSEACYQLGIRMDVFDSFEGLPPSDSTYYEPHDFAGSLDEVRKNVSEFGRPQVVTYHKGFFSETLGGVWTRPLCIWMDVDLALSSRDVMTILGLLPPESCVFSDECTPENFSDGDVKAVAHPNDVIQPLLDAFEREGRQPRGRLICGYMGAFWDKRKGFPILPAAALERLRQL